MNSVELAIEQVLLKMDISVSLFLDLELIPINFYTSLDFGLIILQIVFVVPMFLKKI